MTPMLDRAAAAIVLNRDVPDKLKQQGLTAGDLRVSRLLMHPDPQATG